MNTTLIKVLEIADQLSSQMTINKKYLDEIFQKAKAARVSIF